MTVTSCWRRFHVLWLLLLTSAGLWRVQDGSGGGRGRGSQSVAKCRGSKLGEGPEGLPQPLLATLEQEAATLRRDATSSSEAPSLW